jgi:NADP-dependent 3-hydroxy acid dehydrogenase YdfG
MIAGKKCILITGAASGIGRATALLFANKGWYVGLYDMNGKGLEALSREIGHGNCCYKTMDVSNTQSVRKGIEHFSKNTGGKMDVLFNNAGIVIMGPLENIDIKEEFRVIDVNLKGVLNCIHASLGVLKNTKESRIINMSSASSLYGTAYLAVYSATKAAISSLSESLNLELGQHGIFVSDIRAPYVRTPLLEKDVKAPSIEKLGIGLVPNDVAKTVFKASKSRKIHNDTRGIKPLLVLLILPGFVRNILLKLLLLPSK